MAARLALVHEFKTRSRIFISTEAGAKGLNLQFCDTLVNYDLPWNPQRIEQRIGRCHRYGQRNTVTVITFLASDNEAQRLTYEILSQKMDLFDTVLDASDQILHSADRLDSGTLVSALGAEFENELRRIYERSRTIEEVTAELHALRERVEEERRRFEDAHARAASLIEERFDEGVKGAFRRHKEAVPRALAELDRDLLALCRAYLDARAIPHKSAREGGVDLLHVVASPALPDALREGFAKLGKAWETAAESAVVRAEQDARAARATLAEMEKALTLRSYQASEAEREAQRTAGASAEMAAALGGPAPEALLRKASDDLAEISRSEAALDAEVQALGTEATAQVEKALAALEASRNRLGVAREGQVEATQALDAARAELNTRLGEHRLLVAQVAAMNREAASELVHERKRELDSLPVAPALSEADLAAAERRLEEAVRRLDSAKEDLHKAEGALSKVGGDTVREEVARLDDALAAARERERERELDADAWRLLRETLVEVEKRESAHLGRALAAPVTARFAELTGSRYGGLRLDQSLKAEGVEIAGVVAPGSDVLGALSVGTRNQLATLIRLTIADQLKSAIVLDDHLVNTDRERLEWFRGALRRTALNAQVIVLTCRPEDYLAKEDLPAGVAMRDLGGGAVRAIDAAAVIRRWEAPRPSV